MQCVQTGQEPTLIFENPGKRFSGIDKRLRGGTRQFTATFKDQSSDRNEGVRFWASFNARF